MRPIDAGTDREAPAHHRARALPSGLPRASRQARISPIWRGMIAQIGCVLALGTGCANLDEATQDETTASDTARAEQTEQTEQALATLSRMSEFLSLQPTLRFEADIQYDAVQRSGQKIEFGSQRKVALARPDHIRVDVSHWNGEQELIAYDGHHLSATLPGRRVYASREFEGSGAEALELLVNEHGLAAPLSDLLRRDLTGEIADRVISARHIRTVTIGGLPCDHLAFRAERVDFQLFIQQGDEPLPVRFVIDYHAESGSPQFRAQLHDWDFAAALPDSLFRFSPAVGAQRIPFHELMVLLLGPLDKQVDER